jgi:hypothetical protein
MRLAYVLAEAMNLTNVVTMNSMEKQSNILPDVCNFLLLLVVCPHLTHFILLLSTNICGVVTSIVE